jgi:rhodanese-related sulfurtransferase
MSEPTAIDPTAIDPIAMDPIAIDRDAVHAVVDARRATVVEALPAPYYEDAHQPTAQNLPHDSDDATIAAVLPDRDATVVVYCSNLACQNSTILSRRLVQLGYTDVREYEGGKEDWITAGLPVETSAAVASS